MPKITLDDKEYNTEEMSQDALAQVQSIQFVDNELVRVQMKGAALQTAKNAYVRALKSILEEGENKDDEASIDLPEDLNFD
mgnify:CR=1 FL=1